MTKHKWHNEIVAWADGAEIEMWYSQYDGWGDCINPMFYSNHNYRIKLQPKQPKYLYVIQHLGVIHLSEYSTIPSSASLIGKIEVLNDD
jgi:hypothetical protein